MEGVPEAGHLATYSVGYSDKSALERYLDGAGWATNACCQTRLGILSVSMDGMIARTELATGEDSLGICCTSELLNWRTLVKFGP